MEGSAFKDYLDKIYAATQGKHPLISKLLVQANKPYVLGFWADKIVHIFNALPQDIPDVADHLEPPEVIPEAIKFYGEQPTDPQEIILLKREAKALHKEESILHRDLCRSHSKTRRYAIALRLCTVIGPKLDGIYTKIKKFNSSGNVPIELKELKATEDVRAIYNSINSLKSRISRLRKMVDDPQNDKREKHRAELLQKNILLTELMKKIGV